MTDSHKSTLKKATLVFLFALIAIGLIGGTVAWLTATDDIENQFSVGSFTIPTTEPSAPSQTITPALSGNLYEENWDEEADHKLLPGETFTKDPRVGLGPNSEDAIVYLCVKNPNGANVYFTIDNGWVPVTNYTTAGSASGSYNKGLFKYNSTLTSSASADVWTTPLFSQIVVDDNASSSDFVSPYNITVSSFIHQAMDGNTAIPAADIEAAAKTALTDCPANS